jgi:arginine decarboxylase
MSQVIGELARTWTTQEAAERYRIEAWSEGYFGIDPSSGHVVARPSRTASPAIDLVSVVDELRRKGLQTPVLIRFSNILEDRLTCLHDAFAAAIAEHEYPGEYRALYPIKVNQQRAVVDEVYRFGRRYGFGLEVGSKPELLAVIATAEEPDRLVVCNGFKDDRYIEAIILATKLGRSIIPIVENFSELGLILKHALAYGVKPRLGVRVKLVSQGAGRWRDSGGTRSKFGLFPSELLEVHETLKRQGLEDCLELVHCHPGSQVQDIRRLKDALSEIASVYVELARLGSGVRYLDVGGGLGVDYSGVQAAVDSSMNYSLEEYASDVVYRVVTACNAAEVVAPTLLSESGRAMVAHHSVLVFDVLGRTGSSSPRVIETLAEVEASYPELPAPIRDLFDARESLSAERLTECYHDAQQAREEAVQLFRLGYLDLRLRGLADRLFWSICTEIQAHAGDLEDAPEELGELEAILSAIYFCNLSIFQSLPDSWAIEQLFPVMPIHRLDTEPTVKAVLADLTCDSDGKIDTFVGEDAPRRVLDVHELEPGEPYFLGAFLVGAYQETLGDLHNLFGDTHVAHVELDGAGDWTVSEVVEGDSAAEVLGYVGYSADVLYERLRRECTESVSSGSMTGSERQTLLAFYRDELAGYTYFEHR